MDEGMNISLEEYFIIIKEKLSLIIFITLSTVIIAGILSFLVIKPTYQASTSIIVGKPQVTGKENTQYNDVMMYQNLVKTYSEIAKSTLVAQGAYDKLQGEVPVTQIEKAITVTPQTGTQILIISAKGKSPQEAYNITNAASEAFVDSAKKVFPTGGDIQAIDKAVLPENPVSPNIKLNIAIAFFLGLMVSVGIVFLMEYLDNTIKTENDIEKYLQLPVLGIIPKII